MSLLDWTINKNLLYPVSREHGAAAVGIYRHLFGLLERMGIIERVAPEMIHELHDSDWSFQ